MFFDVTEAAEFLRVKPSTLYGWVHERRVPYRKHGRRLTFARADLEAWSAAQAVEPYAMVLFSNSSLTTRRTAVLRPGSPRQRRNEWLYCSERI
jgi:excisionase family DNA binding protein